MTTHKKINNKIYLTNSEGWEYKNNEVFFTFLKCDEETLIEFYVDSNGKKTITINNEALKRLGFEFLKSKKCD